MVGDCGSHNGPCARTAQDSGLSFRGHRVMTERYIYIDRQLPYLVMIMMLGFAAGTASQIWFEFHTGWWPFALFTFAGVMSFGLSLPLSFTGRGFDIALHEARVRGWRPR